MSASVALLALAAIVGAVRGTRRTPKSEKVDLPPNHVLAIELVTGKPNSLRVPPEVLKSLGIRSGGVDHVAIAEKPTRTRPLQMPGSTALDPARLLRVRVKFAPAEMIAVGKIDDPHGSPGFDPPLQRDLQVGDAVKKGDLLAVLSSVDVGNKKNDLFNALVQLHLDEEVLERAEGHAAAVPEVFLLGARRSVQEDMNAVNRAENTLKMWDIPEADIRAVRDEVQRVSKDTDKQAASTDRLKQWARVELKAAEDGVIIEQNVAAHETVVDNTINLFQIAQVDPLLVLAAVPEDDLPALQQLKNHTRGVIEWTVRTDETEPLRGQIDAIGYLIDPNQHTAVVRGHIPNAGGLLRAGQFVTATVDLLPPVDVVEVPIGAVIEDGWDSIVFVQPEAGKPIFTLRRVQVTNRFERTAYIRSVSAGANGEVPSDNPDAEAPRPTEPLREGERVLTVGALELKAALAAKLSEAATP